MRAEPDAVLIRRVMSGDTRAYAGLVERYRNRLGRYAYRMLGNSADVEEVLQDSFVRAYRSLHRCDDPERFGAWIFGIMVNRCRTLGAQRARREQTLIQDDDLVSRASVRDRTEDAALREAINWALTQLSPEHREAFLLKHVEDLSYEEMSQLTGTGVSALKMRVLRAREQLQRLLAEVPLG